MFCPFLLFLCAQMELTHLAACCDALWALDTHGRVSIRTLSPSCPFGLHWASLDLSQLGTYRSRTLEKIWSHHHHITQSVLRVRFQNY